MTVQESKSSVSTEPMLPNATTTMTTTGNKKRVSGIFVPTSAMVAVGVSLAALLGLQVRSLVWFLRRDHHLKHHDAAANAGMGAIPGSLRAHDDRNHDQCRYYMAESAIPGAGLGVFAATGVQPGDFVGLPDVCIYLSDTMIPEQNEEHRDDVARNQLKQLHSHGWNADTFFGQFEGDRSRAACEGLPTLMNSMPQYVFNTELVSMRDPTSGGLDRYRDAGAGAITHYFGATARAIDTIPAGSELTTDYAGDFGYDESRVGQYKRPKRSMDWIRENGLCIDNIEIGPATDPTMGRGAFALRSFARGDLVAPAPLQVYANRSHFARFEPEELFVNYLFEVKNVDQNDLLFFPYGPGVNLINHDGRRPNVALRWSSSPMHRDAWMQLPPDQLLDVSYAGGLILEVYALRPIREGEELYLDYGSDWETAWNEHVREWTRPSSDGDDGPYVYPADMDETDVLRTVAEQEREPYPWNLAMACSTPAGAEERGENRTITWSEPWLWTEGFVHCNVLEREEEDNGDVVYTVSLNFDDSNVDKDLDVPPEERFVDRKVPRRAIRFVDRPYESDQHLRSAFRHPMALPDHLVPSQWKKTAPERPRDASE